MLARLQRTVCATLVLLACLAAWWGLGYGKTAGFVAFVAVASVFPVFLAIEFVVFGWVNQRDPAGPPSVWQLCRAWWGETRTGLAVFGWRQPFRSTAEPDYLPVLAAGAAPRRGVVLVHGFFCNRGFWTPWLRALRQRGHAFVAVNLEPLFGSIDAYAAQIERAVRDVHQATGCAPVLVCHSMGGLAVRAWLRARTRHVAMAGGPAIAHVVTIGTPHHGTLLARFGHGQNARQMRWHSDWLAQLAGDETAGYAAFTCWYSNCDNIVGPASTATLPGADNRLIPACGHVELAFEPRILGSVLAQLMAESGK